MSLSKPSASPKTVNRQGMRVDPTVMLERSFLQWNMIDSIANAVLGWFIICTYLFWRDPVAEAWSISGVAFIFIGLTAFANIFGVFLYLTNKTIMIVQKKRHPPFPSLKRLKQLSWISNIVWFILMFIASKYAFDLTYETIHTIVTPR